MNEADASLPVVAKGRYRHNKSGHFYEVIGIALQTETNEPLVIYRPLSENRNELFARPYLMFTEEVEIRGSSMQRFEKVED